MNVLATVAVLVVGCGAAFATSYPLLEPEAMLERADIVAFAEVTGVRVELRDGAPWTVVEFVPSDLFRYPRADGDDPPTNFTLAFLGGEVGDVRLAVAQMPTFTVGDEVLLFAYDQNYASPLVGFRQGAWFVRSGVLRDADGRLLDVADGVLMRGGDGVAPADLLPTLREKLGGAS